MNSLRALLHRIRRRFMNQAAERELSEEIASNLEFHVAELVERGIAPAEARRQALIQLGGIDQAKELYRDQSRLPFIETFLQDVRYALRGLRRSPGFTLTAVLTLALGIGATTAIFSAVYGLLIRPLPYRNPARLLWVGQLWHALNGRSSQMVLAPDVFAWRERGHPFESVAAYNFDELTMTGAGDPMWLSVAAVNSKFLTTLGLKVAMGRDFVRSDNRPGAAHVVIVSDSIWKNRLHSDAGAVGRVVDLNGKPYTVVGVLPVRFRFPDMSTRPEALVPLEFTESSVVPTQDQGIRVARVIARLSPGRNVAQARAELEPIEAARLSLYPQFIVEWARNGRELQFEGLQVHLVGNTRAPILILLAAVGLVLLIACANVANLQLVRAAARRHQVAVRSALGASRRRIARQLLTESLLVGVVSAAIGLALAFWIVAFMRNLNAAALPWIKSIGLEPQVFLFSLVVGVLSAAVFGTMPARLGCRVNPFEALKATPMHMVSDDRNSALRRGFLVAELALALVLLIGAGLLIRSFRRLMSQDLGFEPGNVLIAKVQLPHYRYEEASSVTFWNWANSFNNDLLQRLQSLPGVRYAAIANMTPLETEG
ncbi:MAG: ABC transporter permease, partial [Acidobacteria bacterium]|nr:ABC transporter permease [Acidobacteriota bacterium]